MNKKDIGIFEANFLDGDSIDDCGKATFSVSGVMDVVDFFQNKQKEEMAEKIKKMKHLNPEKFDYNSKMMSTGFNKALEDILKELNK